MPVIIPTKRCDLRCTHCMRDDYSHGDMSPELLKKFLLDFGKHSNQRKLHSMTGGEPTIHKNLHGLLGAFRETKNSLYIVTNGQSEQGVETVIKNRDVIDYISISLDAPVAEINDLTRGVGTFNQAVKNAKHYMDNGVNVVFRYVLHDKNVDYLEQAYILAKNLGMKRLGFSTLHPVAKASNAGLTHSNDTLLKAYKKVLGFKDKYPTIQGGMNTRHMIPYLNPEWPKELCTPMGGQLNGWVLLPDGKVSFCCDLVDYDVDMSRYDDKQNAKVFNSIIGDITKNSITEIKENKRIHMNKLKKRRREDVANGNLLGARQYICENCKYYHCFE